MEEHYKKAIEIFMEINTPISLAEAYSEFGMALKEKGDTDQAKVELRRAANLFLHLNLDKQVKRVLKEIDNLG
jgi:Flp pilus assembly protein TadD